MVRPTLFLWTSFGAWTREWHSGLPMGNGSQSTNWKKRICNVVFLAEIRTSWPNKLKAFCLTLARLGHSWEMEGKYCKGNVRSFSHSPPDVHLILPVFAVRCPGAPTKLVFGLIFIPMHTTAGEKENCLMQRVENWSSNDPVMVVPIPGVL